MPKRKHIFHIKYYDSKDHLFFDEVVSCWTYQELYCQFLEKLRLHLLVGFTYIRRIDIVSGNHVLFVFCDVRSFVDQFNHVIKIQSYD